MNHTTRKFPRTLRDAFGLSARESIAIEIYRTPLTRRFFYALFNWGWAIFPVVVGVLLLTGCSDADDWGRDQASLADAVAMAAKEAGK